MMCSFEISVRVVVNYSMSTEHIHSGQGCRSSSQLLVVTTILYFAVSAEAREVLLKATVTVRLFLYSGDVRSCWSSGVVVDISGFVFGWRYSDVIFRCYFICLFSIGIRWLDLHKAYVFVLACLPDVCSIHRWYHWTIFATGFSNRFDRFLWCPSHVSSEHFCSRCCQFFYGPQIWSSVRFYMNRLDSLWDNSSLNFRRSMCNMAF